MKKTYRLLLALAPFFALPTAGLAQTSAVPSYISYQGSVAAADGTAVGGSNAPVNRSVVFRIWSHPTNSANTDLLYSETQVVTIVDGQFSVLIGEGVATTVGNYGAETTKKLADIATAFAGRDCYLGVTVAAGATLTTNDNEISPRQRIVSTGFAFRAKVAENLIGTASLAGGTDFTINPSALPAGITASNYGLGWYGTGRAFGTTTATVDGPVLYGNSGGALGSSNGSGGTKSLALLWNNAGQVGIGATGSFATGSKLTLQGDDTSVPAGQLSIRGNTDINKRLLLGYNTTSNLSSLQAYSAAATTSDILLNPSGGNIGIGMTTAPTQKLQVNGSVASLGYTFAAGDIDGGLFSPADGVITLRTNNTERVRVDAGGNVGIGTNTPGFPLSFTNTLGDKIALWGTSGNSYGFGVQGSLLQIHTDNSGGDIAFGYGSSAAMTETMRIKSTGNVGIGTNNPIAGLHVVKATTGVSQEFAFKVDKINTANTANTVLWVRTFGNALPYNLELFEGQAFKPGGGAWGVVSDRRLKTDILPLDGALDRLLKLKSATFKYKDPKKSHQYEGTQIGFIAQEVEEVFPEWVTENGEGYKTVSIRGFESLTVQALRELRAEKDAEIQTLRDDNAALRRELAAKDASHEARLIAIEHRISGEGAAGAVPLKMAKAAE